MKNFRRILATLLMLLMLVSSATMFFSCDEGGNPDESEVSENDTSDTVDSETEAPIALGSFKITKEVKIARPDAADQATKDACQLLAQTLLDTYGIRVRIISDWNAATGPEIMVGECTHREEAMDFTGRFYKNGYGYAILSADKIVISSMTSDKIAEAANLFIEEVIKKNAEPEFEAGVELIRDNEKPNVDYKINGVNIEEYSIVAESVDKSYAIWLHDQFKKFLNADLPVVAADKFEGGHAIKLGAFGSNCFNDRRFKIGSEKDAKGVSTVYLDGDSDLLLDRGVEFLYLHFFVTYSDVADFRIPEAVYGYRFGNYENTELCFKKIVEQKTLYEGVDYYQMKYVNGVYLNVDAFVLVVSGDSKAEFRSWAGDLTHIDAGKEKFDVKTVTEQVKEYESVVGEKVIAATNASYFMMSAGTNYPWTMRIIQGVELCPPRETTSVTRPANWMGITYDRQLVTGNAETYYSTWKGKLEYALACGIYMMKDGKVMFQDNQNIELNPLTAVATTADGGFVLLCVDGRPGNGNGTSAGATSADMLGIMLDLELLYPDIEFVDVYTMDGGGSTEMVVKNDAGKFVTMNDPCNVKNGKRGYSRAIGDIIAIVIPND